MPLRIWIALITLNLVWAANPIAAKILLKHFVPDQVAWVRYTSAILGLVLIAPLLRWRKIRLWKWPRKSRTAILIIVTGVCTFFCAPLLTIRGLSGTQPSEAALIVALEPLWSVILAAAILKESVSVLQRWAFFVATCGFLFLSLGSGSSAIASGSSWKDHLFFNFLLLLAQAAEAGYSIAGKPALKSTPPGALFTMALLSGWSVLTIWVVSSCGVSEVLDFHSWTSPMLGAAVWLGALGSTLGYLAWAFALGQVPVAALAMTLFVQPIGGALLGVVVWGDDLSALQIVGAFFILIGIALPLRIKK